MSEIPWWDNTVRAVYEERVYHSPHEDLMGPAVCFFITAGLCEIVMFPAALMATAMQLALSSVEQVVVIYASDGQVTEVRRSRK